MSETYFEGNIITVKVLEDKWEVVEHAPAVAVIVERDGRVLGVRQRRRPSTATRGSFQLDSSTPAKSQQEPPRGSSPRRRASVEP